MRKYEEWQVPFDEVDESTHSIKWDEWLISLAGSIAIIMSIVGIFVNV